MASFSVNSVAEVRHTLGQHTAVTRAGNGDLLAMYGDFTDQMEGQTGYLVRSRDGGESWGEPELALRPRWWRGGTHTSLGMQTLSDGRILLPWTHGESLKHNPTGRTRFVCLRSDDHGRSWQGWDEQALPFHRVSPYGTIVELADGTLLCPAAASLAVTTAISARASCCARPIAALPGANTASSATGTPTARARPT